MGKGTRASTACARCYKCKKKCSRAYPTCAECARAGAQCIGLDRGTEAELPRSLVSFLEDTVAHLELERLYGEPPTITPGSATANVQELYNLAEETAMSSLPSATKSTRRGVLPYHRTFFMGAELPFPLAFKARRTVRMPCGQDDLESTRLPGHVADKLFGVYTERILPQYPLFSRQEALELYHAYRSEPGDTDLISPEDSFIVLMILAISVLSSKSKDYRQLVSLAESLRRDAFSRIQFDILTSNTSCSSVRRLILIAQYGFFLPSSTNLWQVVGDATRMALELGLHEEVPEHPGIDEIAVDSRRRLFWVLYAVERSVAITSHRPFAIANDQVGISRPTTSDDPNRSDYDQSISSHALFHGRLSILLIQSEICSVNIGKRAIPQANMTYEQWMTDTERRIIESKSHAQSSGCFDLIVWQAMMLLHMPCARNQEPTADSVYKCFDAAVQLASKHWDIAQSDYVDQPWHAAHNCYEAGMLILYHLWYFPTIADQYTTGQVFDVVHKLSGFFILISKYWPDAQQCGNLFDRFRKGALTAFREGHSLSFQDSHEAKQLKDIVFRENADLLYAYEQTQTIGGAGLDAPFDPFQFSMDFSKDNDFLDFFSFSEASVDLHGAEQGDLGDLLSAEMMDSSQMTLSQNNLVQPPEGVQESHPNVDQAQLDKALRNLPVCTPCKQRRIKCDIVLPSCRNCTKLHKDCTFWDIALSQEIPRKHIYKLKDQIESLMSGAPYLDQTPSVGELGTVAFRQAQPEPDIQSVWPETSGVTTTKMITNVLCRPRHGVVADAVFFGATSSFSRLLNLNPSMPTLSRHRGWSPPSGSSFADLLLGSLSLNVRNNMPIEVAKELVERYYRCIETYYPILGIQLIHETLHSVYSIPVGESGDVEVMVRLRLIISIALSLLGAQDQRLKIAANASFHEAVSGGVSGDLFVTPTISSFQLVLMMCIYVWLTPSAGNIWRLLGHASRMCLDMIEKYGSDKDGTEPAKVGVLYRSLYAIETRVAIAYGRPRQLPLGNELPFTSLDQDITSTSDLSGMMYDLARLKNRFYKDIIGIDTGPLANDGMLPNFPDLSWMDTCVIEIYSWLENWRTSVQNLQAQFADNKAINMEESLLHWGEFQQSEALLLAKKASDRREKIIITNDEEHRLCVRMIRNVEGLQKGSRDFLFPIMWTAMHSMFTAGTLIAQYMASEALPDLGDEQIFRSCLTMLESLEAGIERDCIGLSVCLRNIYDSYQLPKSLRD